MSFRATQRLINPRHGSSKPRQSVLHAPVQQQQGPTWNHSFYYNNNNYYYNNHGNNRYSYVACMDLHTMALPSPSSSSFSRDKKQRDKSNFIHYQLNNNIINNDYYLNNQVHYYHSSSANDRAAAIMLGLGALSAGAYAASAAVSAYQEWKASQPSPEEFAKQQQQQKEQEQEEASTANAKDEASSSSSSSSKQQQEKEGARTNIFKEWFGSAGTNFYEGGFDEEMTKREAALILGVRESSPPARIKEAHRKLLILNHPDTGGSTYIAGKINEAKELLLKGKRGL